ncbi:hypothetical protein MNBD_BACTEROID05-1070, partial [hydrothermal vent metagenome]
MGIFKKNSLFICLSVVVLLTGGCSTKKAVMPRPAGFLEDYSQMTEHQDIKGLFVRRHVTKNIGDYSKFLIAPVQVYFQPDSKGIGVNPQEIVKLTSFVQDQLKEGLSEHYTVVDEPGEDVLLIRAAITEVVPNKIYLNLHWSTTMMGAGIGGASFEAEFLDAGNGEQILAVIDRRKGNRVKYLKGLSKWGHTKEVLQTWVDLLVEQ